MLFPEFTSGGDDRFDDRVLDPPNGLGPIKLFDVGACEMENTLFYSMFLSLPLFFLSIQDNDNDTSDELTNAQWCLCIPDRQKRYERRDSG